MEVEERSALSENSLASLPASDHFINSGHFPMKEKTLPIKMAAVADQKKRIRISVKKLREVTPPSNPECSRLMSDEATDIPPALLVNKLVSREPTVATSGGVAKGAVSMCTDRRTEWLRSSEKNIQLSQLSPKTCPDEAALGVPSLAQESGSSKKAADIFISQYDTGQKEAVRAVFKQRIQSAPVFKEVKVQLLDHASPAKKDSSKSTRSEVDSATTIAAATAAAIASTAPLLKVQSDLEAKVNSVSEILSKLQETDKQLQYVVEQQTSLKAQRLERPPCHHRVSELEKQMTAFMEQRIQHLEKLQQQQMNLQSHLISSALNPGGYQAVTVPSSKVMAKHTTNTRRPLADHSSHPQDLLSASEVPAPAGFQPYRNYGIHRQRSPLKTPAPRRYAPVPVSKEVKFSPKMSKKAQPIGEKENLQIPSCEGTLGGGRLLEQILNSQETPLSQSTSFQKEPANNNKMLWHLERERSNAPQIEPFPAFKNTLQDLNPVERTVKKANDVLQDLGQLKREMNDILQGAKEWKSDMDNLMKKEPVAPGLHELQLISKSSIRQTTQASKSILRDAEKILRGVRKNKKVLEENLEAIIHAKDGNTLHAFIDALTADKEVLEEIRIRKTVDEWIKTITLEIQDEMARRDYQKTQQTIRDMKTGREVKAKSQYPQGLSMKSHLPLARPSPKLTDKGPPKRSRGIQNEDSLSRVYGKPIYQGHRSTLKKSPYLRLNSPSPKSKPPRPKLVECVRGTKVKSARTQTSPCVRSQVASSKKPRPFSAPHQELQYLFSPIKETPNMLGPLEGHLIPMAVPLGQKQIDSTSPQPAGIIIGEFHPVTVTSPVPPAPPKPLPKGKKPNVALVEMRSEKKDPPKLTVQVLPNVDIDTVSNDSTSVSQVFSTPLLAKTAMQFAPEDGQHEEEEEMELPGIDFVDVIDVSQDEGDDDRIPEFVEPVLEFNRRGETESPKYTGLPFPPVLPVSQPSSDVLDDIIEKRETLENKLVGWVEQEIMARVISGMFPPQNQAVPLLSSSESEDSQSGSSDIVEAAGPGGFQLFVSAGVPVDSDLIRRFVNEALAETVALVLGDREDQHAASAVGIPSSETCLPEKEILLPTPLVTPQTTPPHSPPPTKEPSQVKTPESSPSVTEIDGNIGDWKLVVAAAAAAGVETVTISPISTPVATPVATSPKVATPSPPVSEHAMDREVMESQVLPPNAWGDAELPLEEEKPSPQSEEMGYHPRAVIMSVAAHEEPDSLVLPPSPEQGQPHDLLLQEPSIPPPSEHTPSSGPSTEESSLNATETETADRPISEGEVLYSYGQMLAARGLAEEGLSLRRLSDSLTSTLHDAHEMDYDPPSEGQVVRRSHKGYHREPVFALFSKLSQVPLASQEDIHQFEDSDASVGEVSDGQRPKLTKAAESILMGRSVRGDRPVGQVSEQQPRHTPSPGQCERVAEKVLGDTDVTRGPMSMADLVPPASPTKHEDSQVAPYLGDASQEMNQDAVQTEQGQSRIIRVKTRSEIAQQQGVETALPSSSLPAPAKMSVMIPSANIDDQSQSLSSIHVNSDSSGADTF
ncbi:protein TALPID3 isoform X2 [Tiliqua scincoides]|uniref:protein TALPID3 isoform X2 n=1 Tax=Tiliqua scincoides TaxID=71010 RepID=UPI0034631F31